MIGPDITREPLACTPTPTPNARYKQLNSVIICFTTTGVLEE